MIAGLDHQLVEVAEQFGTRTLWVYKLQMGAPHVLSREERLRKPLSYEDAMAIKEQSPPHHGVGGAVPRDGGFRFASGNRALQGAGHAGRPLRRGDGGAPAPDQCHPRPGPFFHRADDLHRRDVAVIGNSVRERFFAHTDPIGKTLLVDGHSLEVIGTLTKFKSFLGDDQNDKAILSPYNTFKKAYPEAKDHFIACWWNRGRWSRRRTK